MKYIPVIIILFSPVYYFAQCLECSESMQTLLECDINGDQDAVFDLNDVTVMDVGHKFDFYETCSNGNLANLIDPITHYDVTGISTIYAQEFSGDGVMDTCVRIVEVQLIPLLVTISTNNICAGPQSNTTLTANVTNGSSPSYQWKVNGINEGSNSPIFTSTMAGQHEVEVTEFARTTRSWPIDVANASFTGEIIASSDGLCSGGSGVTLTAVPSSGNPDVDYSYVWSTPGGAMPTSRSIVTTTPGNFSVSITEIASDCEIVVGPNTLNDESLSILNINVTDPACIGGYGELEIEVNGGSGAYTFEIEGLPDLTDNSPFTLTGLAAGTYGVTVSDNGNGGCTASSSVTIDEGRSLGLILDSTDPSGIGGNDGIISVTVTNGLPNYNWEWSKINPPTDNNIGSSSSPNFDITDLAAGEYSVTVTDDDGNSCSVTDNVTLDDVICSINASGASPAPACNGGNNGSISLNINNPIGDYVVRWSGQESGESPMTSGSSYTISNLSAGTYSITVEDSQGCQDDISSVIINNSSQFTFNTSLLKGACNAALNGEIRVNNFTNGTTPYMVSWSGPVSGNASANSSSYTITGLSVGSYTINVTDGNGCTNSAQQVFVSELPEVDVDIVGDLVFCSAEISTNLSTSPSNFADYEWSTGGSSSSINITNPGPNSTAGYSVTVTDNAGCTGSAQVQVSGLAPISVALNSSTSNTSVTCNNSTDGRIDINISGGDGNYTYSWTGPNFSSSLEDIDDLGPGEYNLTVMDSEGCIRSFSQSILVPSELTAVAIATEVSCNGDTDGSINIATQGGTGNLTYEWSSPIPASNNSSVASNLAAGTYTVTISDENNCFIVESVTVTEPNAVIANITPNEPQICIGDDITLIANGGTSYEWSEGLGGNQSITVSPNISKTYSVTVTDAASKNCTEIASVTITVNDLPQPSIVVMESSGLSNSDFIICAGDDVTLTASGGLTYTWSDGGGNPKIETPNTETTYLVTVTDVNGCSATSFTTIKVNEPPIADIDLSEANFFVGDIQVLRNFSVAQCGPIVDCTWKIFEEELANDCDQITPIFNSTGDKEISLMVVDSCGCRDQTQDIMEIVAANSCVFQELNLANGATNLCLGEQAVFTFSTSPAVNCTTESTIITVFRNNTLVTTGFIYNPDLGTISFDEIGSYRIIVSVEDNCDCTAEREATIEIIPAPEISFSANNISQACQGDSFTIRTDNFVMGDSYVIQDSEGRQETFSSNYFDYSFNTTGKKTLVLSEIMNGACTSNPTGIIEIIIDIIPESECNIASNDDCVNAIDLGTAPFCDSEVFSNFGASPSNIGDNNIPNCYEGNTPLNDVWFSFNTSNVTNYQIELITEGFEPTNIARANISIYRGSCNDNGIAIQGCIFDSNVLTLNNLTPFETYYLRIDNSGEIENQGQFRIKVLDQNALDEHPDYASLIEFYHATDGPNWMDNTGWVDGAAGINCDPCNGWYGVRCDQNRRVDAIDMDGNPSFTNAVDFGYGGNGLSGNLIEVNLSELRILNLGANDLQGQVPDFQDLQNLEGLWLFQNSLEGEIPNFSNLPRLIHLGLAINNFTGSIPSFSNLAELENLQLAENDLSGSIPSFDNVPQLRTINVSDNNLTGEIPSFLNLPHLSEFFAHNNNLGGCYPDIICQLDNFRSENNPRLPWNGDSENFCNGEEQIDAPCNDSEGIIDENCDCIPLCGEHPDYEGLMELYNITNGPNWTNNTGWIDGANEINCDPCNGWYGVTCEDSRVISLNLDDNKLEGIIPGFRGLQMLSILNLQQNQLSGTIPNFQDIPNLKTLRLASNSLNGAIPDFQFLTNLEFLTLNNNDLSGSLPDFQNLNDLEYLFLRDNLISGQIPNFQNLNKLVVLDLCINNLSGSIPDFQNLSNLEELYLNKNNLTESIPDFQNIPNLRNLYLSDNDLSGKIPEFQSLASLKQLHIENNKLSGCYPDFVCEINIFRSTNNPLLPWNGDYQNLCNGEDQIGALCNNDLDLIDSECKCVAPCSASFMLAEEQLFLEPFQEFEVAVLENDMIPDSATWILVENSDELLSSLAMDESGIISGEVNAYFSDTIRIPYEVCLLNCDQCQISELKLINSVLKEIVLTNIISPNGDGTNDELRFSLDNELTGSELSIFNRWGDRIFNTRDYRNDWVADGYPGGVYFYILEYRDNIFKSSLTVLK